MYVCSSIWRLYAKWFCLNIRHPQIKRGLSWFISNFLIKKKNLDHHGPSIFPSCSHHVPIAFPSCSHHFDPSRSHHVPIMFPSFWPIVLPSCSQNMFPISQCYSMAIPTLRSCKTCRAKTLWESCDPAMWGWCLWLPLWGNQKWLVPSGYLT